MTQYLKAHITTLFAAALFAGKAIAGTEAKPEPKKTEPLPLLSFADGKVVFDVQEKMRLEGRENNFDFNSDVNGLQDDAWLLQRFRLGLGIQLTPWLKIYAQGQDVREIGGSRPNTPGLLGAEGDDYFDLLKGYVQFGDLKKGFSATVGRQFLSYGDQRLVGPLEWLNQARTFDAVKLRYATPNWQLDLFTSSPIIFTTTQFNKSSIFDVDEPGQVLFSGAYLATKMIPYNLTTDFYLFHKKDQGLPDFGPVFQNGDTSFFTLGTLWKGDPKKMRGWDYDVEMAAQIGEVAGRDLAAFAGHWSIGYNWLNLPWKPRLGVQYNFGSGDSNRQDGNLGTFQNLYPTNHLFYGFMDTTAWQNVSNPQLNFSVMPTEKLKLTLDYHVFWNSTSQDVWYRANGITPVRRLNAAARAASLFRGQEVDLTASYKFNRHLSVLAGYSVFFAGDYLADTGASDNAHFGYLQVQIDF